MSSFSLEPTEGSPVAVLMKGFQSGYDLKSTISSYTCMHRHCTSTEHISNMIYQCSLQ